MRVLYFMNHVDTGGAALALYDLVFEIKKYDDIEPIVITGKKNSLNDMLTKIGVENYSAPFKNFLSTYKEPVSIFRLLLLVRYLLGLKVAIFKIEKIIDFSKIDIIHTNLDRVDIGAVLAKKYSIPHVWHIREHGDGSDFKLMSIKADPISYMNSFDSSFITVSRSVSKVWKQRGLRTDEDEVIYDGVRTELYKPMDTKKEFKLRIVFLGGYTKNKGQEDLILALKDLPNYLKSDFTIDFYGSGSKRYINKLKKMIEVYNLSCCMNLNPYSSEVYKKLAKYDIGLTCSHSEAFGRVTVEYMMAGLCPIVSNGGATTEIVKNGETGLIFNVFDRDDLRRVFVWALNNKESIYNLGRNASVYAKKHFSMKEHAYKVRNKYFNILSM